MLGSHGINPYERLGLRANPFVAEQVPGVASTLWIDRGHATPPQASAREFVQVVGQRGAGKTSLLLHWREQAPGPYHYVQLAAGRWQTPPIAPLVYWDEVDRMPLPLLLIGLWRARRVRATVVAGTHVDLGWVARRFGLAVRTISFPGIDAAAVHAWARLRIAVCTIDSAPQRLTLNDATATQIAAEANGCWRTVAVRLHVWAAEQSRGTVESSTMQPESAARLLVNAPQQDAL